MIAQGLYANIHAKRKRIEDGSGERMKRKGEKDTAIPDEWKTYRQALRDVPQQAGFPNDIEWPEKP